MKGIKYVGRVWGGLLFFWLMMGCEQAIPTEYVEDKSPEQAYMETYEERLEALGRQEGLMPLKFLSFEGEFDRGFYGGAHFYLSGVLKNKAAVATFKDVTLEISFLTKTNTVLRTEEIAIYEYVPPRKGIRIKEKISRKPSEASLEWRILSANPVD